MSEKLSLRLICLLLFPFTLLSLLPVNAQRHEIYSSRIATLQVVAGDNWLSPPVTTLGGQPVYISFDDLTHEYHRYTYTLEHCEADWRTSEELLVSDFCEGFAEGNTIDDLEESINTNQLYTHYTFSLPNERCRFKLSGNYRVTVYDENNDNEPMFSACFMVVEPRMGVSLSVTTNTDRDINGRHQQVAMQLNYGNVTVTDPERQLTTVVMQNGRRDNAVVNAKPQYVMYDGLRWEHNPQYIFDGGNEYHKFETLDVSHTTLGLESIRWDGTNYHAFLWTDVPRPSYVYDEDANGAFYIRNSDNFENDRTTEYVLVHFTLKSPRYDGSVYLDANWTLNQFIPQYELQYNDQLQAYETVLPLKQGYYSYQYLLVTPDGRTQPVPTEGNFFQTENQYQALIYFRPPGGRTDQLVAYTQFNAKP